MMVQAEKQKNTLNYIGNEMLDFAAISDLAPEALLFIDHSLSVYWANQSAQSLFQKSLKSYDLSSLLPPGCKLIDLINRATSLNRILSAEDLEIKINGSKRFFSVYVQPLNNRYLLSLRKRPALVKSSFASIETIQTMAAMLAHEIKNPLTSIKGAAQIIEQKSPDKKMESLSKVIQLESQRIHDLVDRMAFLEGGSDSEMLSSVNIHVVLDHVIKAAQAGYAKNISIECDFDPSLPEVNATFDKLVQMFSNLLKNASEACAGIETPQICIRSFFTTTAKYSADRSVPLRIGVQVIDNGCGIAEDIQKIIFSPFFTTRHEGTGLGLPMVAKLVEDHKGLIELGTSKDKTCFSVYLPVYEDTENE